MGNVLRLAVLLTGLLAAVFVSCSVYWNLLVLPVFRERGVETTARLVEIVPPAAAGLRSETLVVSHRPDPAGVKYRNWLRSAAASGLERRSKPGVTVPVIYLPDQPQARAVLAADFDFAQQAPLNDPRFAAGALVLFGLCLALQLAWRRRLRRLATS